MYDELAILTLFISFYSMVAVRLERSVISGPIVFVAAGFLMGPLGSWLVRRRCFTSQFQGNCRPDPRSNPLYRCC